MADIASETLHNIGNVLNSVKTSGQMIEEVVARSPIIEYAKASELLRENMDGIEDFIANDPKGKILLQYFLELDGMFTVMRDSILQTADRLNRQVDVITNVVASQNRYVNATSMTEPLNIIDVVEEALEIFSDIYQQQKIDVIKNFVPVPETPLQKTKLIHVLINLFKNSWEAMRSNQDGTNNKLTLELSMDDKKVSLKVHDTGSGISKNDLSKIFSHGFTIKKDGFGFGLHSSANYLNEMGGTISASSEGKGATFLLSFPVES